MGELSKRFGLFRSRLRASNIISPFGVGAMIDLPEQVIMVASADLWKKGDTAEIHDERLEKALKVKGFKTPKSLVKVDDDENSRNCVVGFPFVRFPRWYFCPKCRRFEPIESWERKFFLINKEKENMINPTCDKCRINLSPARIVVACENGHISDFPWIEWVHFKKNKGICKNPKLKIKTTGVSSGLEGITVVCENCNTITNLTGAFNKNVFQSLAEKAIKNQLTNDEDILKCTGNRPWDGTKEKCNSNYPRSLQRGATNIHFPKIESSIVIPPYTEKMNCSIEKAESYKELTGNEEKMRKISIPQEHIYSMREQFIKSIAEEIDVNVEVVRNIVNRKLDCEEVLKDEITKKNKYREEEYKAILGEYEYDIFNQVDFKVEPIEGKKFKKVFIKKVVLVHKMREVRALTAFTRINPPDNNIIETNLDNPEISKHIRVLNNKNWYPAIETRGEGIFIQFEDKVIDNWLKNMEIKNRIEVINKKYKKIVNDKGHSIREITPKFIMLHTFAHLLIKQMSFKCGYSSSSLRERIYCNENENEYSMEGIMIYTASGDAEGTLGGLVRQGREDSLPKLIDSAIEKAMWCSSDPVCIDSKGQGRDALNLAACYSCCLISETSCEEFNILLDRALIVGTLDNPELGFFNSILNK